MGESLSGDGTRVRAVPTGRDAAPIPRCKRESRRVRLWFVAVLPLALRPVLTEQSAEDDEDVPESKEGWDIIEMDGQQVGIRTSAIDEKCQAFETLVIYCSTLGARFAPYLQQSLEMVLQSLRFVLHDGVREACAMYVVRLFFLSC
jgi:hypothetical protein